MLMSHLRRVSRRHTVNHRAPPIIVSFPVCLILTRDLSDSHHRSPLNYYRILQVSHDASPQDVKAAYYRLSKIHHPDVKTHSDDAYFALINEAYEVLGNQEKRRQYDSKSSSFSHLQRRSRATPRRPPTVHPYYSQDFMRETPYRPSSYGPRRGPFRNDFDDFYKRNYNFIREQERLRNQRNHYERLRESQKYENRFYEENASRMHLTFYISLLGLVFFLTLISSQ